MTSGGRSRPLLPEPVSQTLEEFRQNLGLDIRLGHASDFGWVRLFPADAGPPLDGPCVTQELTTRDGPALELQVRGEASGGLEQVATLVRATVERVFDFQREIRFFTNELTQGYEEINLLYTISEALGSTLRLEDAAQSILTEVCDVIGAQRGALWALDPAASQLDLKAAVGMDGLEGPIAVNDPDAVTAEVFREGRPVIGTRTAAHGDISVLSVPVRYTPPTGLTRTVGVLNLIGRTEGRFAASDQKLLSAIASQVGAALENSRLIRESLAKEHMSQEMALAHNLQMKLLEGAKGFDRGEVGARVVPAEQVGGDFYHLFKLPEGRIGVMIGDVSTHGFPAALIMALSLSASSIYAMESDSPSHVLRQLDDALHDELESTEMYLTMFYGIIDPAKGVLRYSNAGHPHAFRIEAEGEPVRLLATDPPIGIAGPASYNEEIKEWNSGDLMFLFTDGLSDTLATRERGTGERLVLKTISDHRASTPDEIVSHLFDLAEAATPDIPSDDRTAVVLRT
jgi:phosphoserine phosphatase RsbU/P